MAVQTGDPGRPPYRDTPMGRHDNAERELLYALDEPLLNAEGAAALLNVRPSWVRDAVRAQRLPVIRVGRHLRFTRSMLERFAEQNRIDPNEPARYRGGRRVR
jgi:excisionase family DNA binding protein